MSTKELVKIQAGNGTTVSNYIPSPSITRTFCRACGTNLLYVADKSADERTGVEPTADFVLGSMNRESLEREGLRPERHIYFKDGVNWVRDLVTWGDGTSLEAKGEGRGRWQGMK
jgi:hypothetical protein